LETNNKQERLAYRGTRDGFASAKFHELCGLKGKSIIFVETSTGKRIGGFASVEWKKNASYYSAE
jgi:hypothetical protein